MLPEHFIKFIEFLPLKLECGILQEVDLNSVFHYNLHCQVKGEHGLHELAYIYISFVSNFQHLL